MDKLANDAAAPLSEILQMKLYKQMEIELDRLTRPTLIVCKSNRRAGAVLAAYKGVKECVPPKSLLRQYSEDGTKSSYIIAYMTCLIRIWFHFKYRPS